MNVHTWALITFSVLAQLSVGSFIVLGIVNFFAVRKVGVEQADKLNDRALLGIGAALVLGLAASLLHLGNPLVAYRAVMHTQSSWLSREILFGVAFAVIGGVFAFMQWRKLGTPVMRNAIAWVAAAVGLALVYSMSRVYMIRTQPAWNTILTPISFFTTTLLLGCLAIAASFMFSYFRIIRAEGVCSDGICELLRSAMQYIAIAVMVLIGIEVVVAPLWSSHLSSLSGGVGKVNEYSLLFLVRLALGFLGAGVLGLFLYQNASAPGKEKVLATIAYSAFGIVLVAEVLNRVLFYVTQNQMGI